MLRVFQSDSFQFLGIHQRSQRCQQQGGEDGESGFHHLLLGGLNPSLFIRGSGSVLLNDVRPDHRAAPATYKAYDVPRVGKPPGPGETEDQPMPSAAAPSDFSLSFTPHAG